MNTQQESIYKFSGTFVCEGHSNDGINFYCYRKIYCVADIVPITIDKNKYIKIHMINKPCSIDCSVCASVNDDNFILDNNILQFTSPVQLMDGATFNEHNKSGVSSFECKFIFDTHIYHDINKLLLDNKIITNGDFFSNSEKISKEEKETIKSIVEGRIKYIKDHHLYNKNNPFVLSWEECKIYGKYISNNELDGLCEYITDEICKNFRKVLQHYINNSNDIDRAEFNDKYRLGFTKFQATLKHYNHDTGFTCLGDYLYDLLYLRIKKFNLQAKKLENNNKLTEKEINKLIINCLEKLENKNKISNETINYKPGYYNTNRYGDINLTNYVIKANSDVEAVIKFHKLIGDGLFSSYSNYDTYNWGNMKNEEEEEAIKTIVESIFDNDTLWLSKDDFVVIE